MGLSNETVSDSGREVIDGQQEDEEETVTYLVPVDMTLNEHLAAKELAKRREESLGSLVRAALKDEIKLQEGYDQGFGHPEIKKPHPNINYYFGKSHIF
jgi:hypothetical protein